GTEIAIGIIESQYKDGITQEEAKNLVVQSIKAAASRDIQSGSDIDLLIITDGGIKEETVTKVE
ncbi:MAG: proteasome subunit beta, partial [Candidatus Bathyarchaeia archaeon]